MKHIFLVLAFVFGLAGNAAAEPIDLKVDGGTLHGALEMPPGVEAMPVALIIAGSGPTDRDGNNPLVGKNNCLKMLALGLAAKGIASLRYDKRGIGASAGAARQEADLRFNTYIADAEKWGRRLQQDSRFSRLVIIGHSEGALIGAMAAWRTGANGFVSLAGAGYPAAAIVETQLKKNLPPALLAESQRILGLLKAGKTADKVPPDLMALFRPSVQPYLISWFRYDPADEIAKIQAPCLIVQGTTDLQISVSDAQQLAQANNRARLLIIKGMNHLLKMAPLDLQAQMKTYRDPDLPISAELVDNVAAFIKEASRTK
jgi:hypothetical protein